jgi:hypothetical protein
VSEGLFSASTVGAGRFALPRRSRDVVRTSEMNRENALRDTGRFRGWLSNTPVDVWLARGT